MVLILTTSNILYMQMEIGDLIFIITPLPYTHEYHYGNKLLPIHT